MEDALIANCHSYLPLDHVDDAQVKIAFSKTLSICLRHQVLHTNKFSKLNSNPFHHRPLLLKILYKLLLVLVCLYLFQDLDIIHKDEIRGDDEVLLLHSFYSTLQCAHQK